MMKVWGRQTRRRKNPNQNRGERRKFPITFISVPRKYKRRSEFGFRFISFGIIMWRHTCNRNWYRNAKHFNSMYPKHEHTIYADCRLCRVHCFLTRTRRVSITRIAKQKINAFEARNKQTEEGKNYALVSVQCELIWKFRIYRIKFQFRINRFKIVGSDHGLFMCVYTWQIQKTQQKSIETHSKFTWIYLNGVRCVAADNMRTVYNIKTKEFKMRFKWLIRR